MDEIKFFKELKLRYAAHVNPKQLAQGIKITALLIALTPVHPAWSIDAWTPRIAALGGAGRGGPLLNDPVLQNPAFTSLIPSNSLSFNWLTYKSNDGANHGRNYSIMGQDGRNDILQAGVAYTLREDAAFVHLGLSRAIVQRFGLGIAAKHIMDPVRDTNVQDGVFAMAAVPIDWFQAAFVIDNIGESELGKAHGMYRDYILGIKMNVQSVFLVYLDPQLTPSLDEEFGYSGGLEFVMMKDLFLRIGGFKNTTVPFIATRGRGWGAGFGWVAPRLSLDYAFSRILEPSPFSAHSFGATAYF